MKHVTNSAHTKKTCSRQSDDVKPDPATMSSYCTMNKTVKAEVTTNGGVVARIIKNEPVKEGDDDSDDGANLQPSIMKNEDGGDNNVKTTTKKNRVLVELKFRSYETQLFKEGGMQGTLHVAMDQDPHSGIYSIFVGEPTFTVHLNTELINSKSWCLGKQKDVESPCLEFTGKLTRNRCQCSD